MSLVQIAYQAVLTKLREWSKLEQKEKVELLQQASNLMGQPFRQALYILEEDDTKLSVYDFDMFFSMLLDG